MNPLLLDMANLTPGFIFCAAFLAKQSTVSFFVAFFTCVSDQGILLLFLEMFLRPPGLHEPLLYFSHWKQKRTNNNRCCRKREIIFFVLHATQRKLKNRFNSFFWQQTLSPLGLAGTKEPSFSYEKKRQKKAFLLLLRFIHTDNGHFSRSASNEPWHVRA